MISIVRMKIAITGATGYVGREFMQRALEGSHDVFALVRSKNQSVMDSERAHKMEGDVRDQACLEKLVQDTDAVVHLAAFVHRETLTPADKQDCHDVNVNGVRNLIQAIKNSKRPQHLIYVSTISVYGAIFSMANEKDPCHPVTTYGQTKLEGERIVQTAIDAGTISGFILRPSMIFGHQAPGNLQKLMRLISLGVFPVIQGGNNLKSMVHIDDLVAILLHCLTMSSDPTRNVYNVASDVPLSLLQVARSLSFGLEKSPIYFPISKWLTEAAGYLTHGMSKMSGGRFPDLNRLVEVFCATTTVDVSAIKHDFNFQFRDTTLELEEVGRNYRESIVHAS